MAIPRLTQAGIAKLLNITYPPIAYEYIAYFPLLGVILGLIIGSFLATLIVRWPEGKSVMTGRSHCDSCGTTLGAADLIPIVSFLVRRGNCRKCGAKIDSDHLAIELVSGLIGGLALFVEPNLGGLFGAIFGWLLLTLAALDAKHHWLPDRLTFLLAIGGLVAALFVGQPDIQARLLGGISGFLALFLIGWTYKRLRGVDGLGGGDPKLLGAIGCWLGWAALPIVILVAATVGLLSVFIRLLRGQAVAADSALPLGIFMAIAAFPIWLMQGAPGLLDALL